MCNTYTNEHFWVIGLNTSQISAPYVGQPCQCGSVQWKAAQLYKKGVSMEETIVKGDVVKLIETGELFFPFVDFYSGGNVRSSGFTAKRIAHYSPNLNVWHPFEYTQRSVHLAAFGARLRARLANWLFDMSTYLSQSGGG